MVSKETDDSRRFSWISFLGKNEIKLLKNYSCEWSNEQKKIFLGGLNGCFYHVLHLCLVEHEEREIFCEFSPNRNLYARRINKKEKKEREKERSRRWEDFAKLDFLFSENVVSVYSEFHEN